VLVSCVCLNERSCIGRVCVFVCVFSWVGLVRVEFVYMSECVLMCGSCECVCVDFWCMS